MHRGAPINPFSTRYHTTGSLPYLDGDKILAAEDLYDTMIARNLPAQIVGPRGTGKSTLMRTLARIARQHALKLIQLSEDKRRLPSAWWYLGDTDTSIQWVFVDGAEQLYRRRFAWLRRTCQKRSLGLLITTHRQLGLSTLRENIVDEKTSHSIVTEVLARCPQAPTLVRPDEAPGALLACGGDMREALFHIYDLYESRWESTTQRGY